MFWNKNKKKVVDIELIEIIVYAHMKSAKQSWSERLELVNVCSNTQGKMSYSQQAHENLVRYHTLQHLYNDLCERVPEFKEAALQRRKSLK